MQERSAGRNWQVLPMLAGPAAFLTTILIPSPSGFDGASWPVLGLTAWMALWWASEAVPLTATAFLPLAVVPLLGLPEPTRILLEYANSSIFLILGGFLIGLAMERWNLHKRIAYAIVARVGSEPRRLVLGMMIATATVSMWVSNTSSTLMMLPVATSIAAFIAPEGEALDKNRRNFTSAIVLCVAYAATIGGLGTLVGTPTNALVQGFMATNYGFDLSFLDWLIFGLPTVALLLPLGWWALVGIAMPFDIRSPGDSQAAVRAARGALGAMSRAEVRVAIVAALTGALWVARPLLNELPGLAGLTDTVIAIGAGLVLFLIPAGAARGPLLHAEDVRRVPWDVLMLFGGGLTLAAAIQASTLADTMGVALRVFSDWPLLALMAVIVVVLVLWTELNSNVATAATFMPVLAALAFGTQAPVLALVAPAAMAASAGFMLPVGTPPNAIVFGTGRVTMRQMIRAGIWFDLLAALVIVAVGYVTVPLIAR
jgi:solute carrier family 13 (sodium-dependent dicarboxylate transporter), member 2/3/5